MLSTPLRALLLGITLLPSSLLHAKNIFFSWWDPLYQTPGLYSYTAGSASRDANLPGEELIQEQVTHSLFKTNQETVSVLVLPKGSDVFGLDPFTGRSQTEFGKNRAITQTILSGFGESEDRTYYDRRSHSMTGQSLWSDRWTFTGPGAGTSPVTLTASMNFEISNSPCNSGTCGQVGNPIFSRAGIRAWWYRIYASVRVFDLDIIDDLYLPDREYTDEVPREIAAFEVFQQGSNIDREFFGELEPYGDIPNKRLAPIHTNGVVTFVPVPGHRYAVIGHINLQSRDGADIDVGTIQLDNIVLGSGLRLQTFGETNGAQYKILSTTRITALPSLTGPLTLSFPTTTGFTYHVESRDTLGATPWNLLATKAGNGQSQTVTDNEGKTAARFYRLRIE